jgi:hypothetical protein
MLGTLVFIPAFFTSVGVGGSVFSFISPLPSPLNAVGPIAGVWALGGLVYLGYLVVRHPQRLKAVERVFSDVEQPVVHV